MIPIYPADAKTRDGRRPGEQSGILLPVLPPLSLYVHFPWCMKKCPYCDFHSLEVQNAFPEDEYLAALRADLESALPQIWGRKVDTVFIGGGTPSLLSAKGLDQMLSCIRALLPLRPDAEITMEANPGAIEADKFKAFRDSGVNRLSIGVQSFNDDHLLALGRIHCGDDARRAIELAQRHFDNFNTDLMYALPGQSIAQARQDIETALGFAPPHMSVYQLTMEPNTYFAKNPPELPDEDTIAEMQEMVEETTAASGYKHYEVSAYAQPGRQARHNLNYWHFGDYLGIGSGAHSKISFEDRIIRQARYRQPAAYIRQAQAGAPVQEENEVGRDDLVFEFMLNALRLTDGFETRLFTDRTGLPLSAIGSTLEEAEKKGLLKRDHLNIRPTELGRRFLIDLQQMFLND